MAEIFLSYDGSDRERARAVREALRVQGFDVLWEHEPPADAEWETWMRARVAQCRCVLALRSASSVLSNKMRHVEATASEQGKLVLVHLEPLLPARQGGSAGWLNLVDWHGDLEHAEWQELRRRVEGKLKASLWVQRLISEVATERTSWRAQYESSARRCKALNEELAQERWERGTAQDRAAGLQAQLDEEAKARRQLEARIVELEQSLSGAKGTHAEAVQLRREELRQKDLKLAEAESALGSEQSETARLRAALQDAETARGETSSRLADQESIASERKARIASLEADISQRDAEIAKLQAGSAERDARIAALLASVTERDGHIAGLKAETSDQGARIAKLLASSAERDSHIADLKARAAEHSAHLATLKASVAERDHAITGLHAGTSERDAYIAELEAGLSQRNTFITNLTASVADQNAYIVKLEANLAQRDTFIASLKANMAELEKRSRDALASRGTPPGTPPTPGFTMLNRATAAAVAVAGVAVSVVRARHG